MATIATHNGSAAHRDHNLRGRSTDKQVHIEKGGLHETWLDEAPRVAYDRLFGDAVEAYNAKQNRDERKIKDYYNKIARDEKKHPVYEMIIGVYGGVPEDACKAILHEFVDDWKRRNPSLELIGAYYHADEQGEPHVHLDYIPVARGYKRGMETQTGLVKALGQQGFFKQGNETAQMAWQRRENQALESICLEYGLQIEHPQKDKGVEHLHTKAYKAQQELAEASEKLENVNKDIVDAEADLINMECEFAEEKKVLSEEIKATSDQLAKLNGELVDQEQLKERTVDRTMLGKKKDTVTMPYEEYKALHHYATLQKNVKSREISVVVKEKQCDERQQSLDSQELRLQDWEEDLNDRIKKAPKYRDEAEKYENLYLDTAEKLEIAKYNLTEAKEALDRQRKENAALKEETKQMKLLKRICKPFMACIDKIKKALDLEEIINHPDGELSKGNRELSKENGYTVTTEYPHASWSNLSNRWQYYWQDSNGDRNGCLRRAYMPVVREIQEEIGAAATKAVLDNDMIQEAIEAERQQSHRSKGIQR